MRARQMGLPDPVLCSLNALHVVVFFYWLLLFRRRDLFRRVHPYLQAAQFVAICGWTPYDPGTTYEGAEGLYPTMCVIKRNAPPAQVMQEVFNKFLIGMVTHVVARVSGGTCKRLRENMYKGSMQELMHLHRMPSCFDRGQ
jgi:hypothetical protein